jgi:hypothetical protein
MGINNRKKRMHIVEVCPDHHFADSRSGEVEHALTAQVFNRILIYMSGLNSGDEEVPTLLPWLWLAYVDHQADATGVP